jgi:hypothetical protein
MVNSVLVERRRFMKNWALSLHGAVALSAIAMLALLARITGIDALVVMPSEMGVREDQVLTVGLFMLGVAALYGAWIWALLAAARGSRGGVIVALIFSLLTALFGGLFTLVILCQPGCAAAPAGNIVVWAELLTGLAASVALLAQLRRG